MAGWETSYLKKVIWGYNIIGNLKYLHALSLEVKA